MVKFISKIFGKDNDPVQKYVDNFDFREKPKKKFDPNIIEHVAMNGNMYSKEELSQKLKKENLKISDEYISEMIHRLDKRIK